MVVEGSFQLCRSVGKCDIVPSQAWRNIRTGKKSENKGESGTNYCYERLMPFHCSYGAKANVIDVSNIPLDCDNTNAVELLSHIDCQFFPLETRPYSMFNLDEANIQDYHTFTQLAYLFRVGYGHRSQLKKSRISFLFLDVVLKRWRVSGSSGTSIGYQRFSKEENGLIFVLYVYL